MPGKANLNLIAAIDAVLPQTQCTRCSYADCRAYATAIANEGVPINQCPPGGASTIARLAELTGTQVVPLNPDFGTHQPRTTALIDEGLCIGCTLCIQACPVDAIVGAAKRMHTVLTTHCTGCELCLPPCPVDCIDMISLEQRAGDGHTDAKRVLARSIDEMAPEFRERYARHQVRLAIAQQAHEQRLQGRNSPASATRDKTAESHANDRKSATIAAAMARARARRESRQS